MRTMQDDLKYFETELQTITDRLSRYAVQVDQLRRNLATDPNRDDYTIIEFRRDLGPILEEIQAWLAMVQAYNQNECRA